MKTWALTTYQYKPTMTKEDMAKLLEVYGKFGVYPGAKEHFEFVDGTSSKFWEVSQAGNTLGFASIVAAEFPGWGNQVQ